jgi:hypothetical protein
MKGRRGTARQSDNEKEGKKKSEKRERNQVVDTVEGSMGMIDRASTMASSTRRAAAKACPTLIVKALGQSVLVYFYLRVFAANINIIIILSCQTPIMGGVARK